MESSQTVGDRIRIVRKMNGLSQEQFGIKLSEDGLLGDVMSRDAVNNLERDRIKNPILQAKAVCLTFNINLDWLLRGVEPIQHDYSKNINNIIDLLLPDDEEYKTAKAVIKALAEDKKMLRMFSAVAEGIVERLGT